jgi:hypothetical protein
MQIETSPVHLEKAEFSMDKSVEPDSKTRLEMDSRPAKQLSSNRSTLFGMASSVA